MSDPYEVRIKLKVPLRPLPSHPPPRFCVICNHKRQYWQFVCDDISVCRFCTQKPGIIRQKWRGADYAALDLRDHAVMVAISALAVALERKNARAN